MAELLQLFAAACDAKQRFFLLPTWYEYLQVDTDHLGQCKVMLDFRNNPGDIWLIGLAIVDIMLHVVGMVAVGFVIYGGFRYLTSQGEPENTKHALQTIINALVGVAIALIASSVVSFVANRISS